MLSKPGFLRYVLMIDAISCLASGIFQLAFTGFLSEHLNLPPTLLSATGEFLLVYGAAVAFLATRTQVPRSIIWLLVAGNCAWGLASFAILMGNDLHPAVLGKGYVAVQGLSVLILATLQYVCVRAAAPQLSVR
jgi:hypothetical protein